MEGFWGIARKCAHSHLCAHSLDVHARNFLPIPIISGTGKATDFKCGRYIHSIHQNESPLQISEKREGWRIQRLPKSFGYPLLFQERVKLRTSNFCIHIHVVDRNKSP